MTVAIENEVKRLKTLLASVGLEAFIYHIGEYIVLSRGEAIEKKETSLPEQLELFDWKSYKN